MLARNRAVAVIASAVTLTGAAAAAVAVSASAHAEDNTIVGGRQVDNPWMVQLVFQQGTGKYGCSGEAIAPDWVLTAQHCVKGTTSMNVYYSNDVTNRGPAVVADKLYASPKGDVALVHLSTPHPLAEYGRITSGYEPQQGDSGEIQGYGLQADKARPTHLNAATVTVLGDSLDAFYGNAVHVQGVDGGSNHGDSGGPLIVDGRIVGVCSTGDTVDPGSDIHATSNYANLTASLPWIAQTSGVTADGPGPAPTPTSEPTTPAPSPTDTPTGTPTETPTSTPTYTPTPAPTEVPTTAPAPAPTTDGGVVDRTFELAAGQTDATFEVPVADGARVRWSGLPAGHGLYVGGRSDGTLRVHRGAEITGDRTFQYTVEQADGTRSSAKVTLDLR